MARCRADVLALALALGVATAAHADSRAMSDDAKRLLDHGQELFLDHDYAGAIAAYDAGFALDPHPDFLYAKAQAQRLAGDCPGAIQSYQGFLASSPPDAEARIARFNVERCKTDAEHPQNVDEYREAPWYRDVLGGVLAGSALVAIGAGATYLVLADGHVDNANAADNPDEYVYERDLARSDRTIGTVATIAGAALATCAVLRYALHDRKERVGVTAVVTGHGGAIVLGGRF
jgi:tetratricopeptide (TPR) repeat protein